MCTQCACFLPFFFNWIRNWRHQGIISISNGLDLWRHMMWIVSIIIHWPHTDAFVSMLTILTRYHRLYNTVLSTQIHSTVNKGPSNRISLARWIRWLLNLCLEKAVTDEHRYIAQESVKTSRLILTLYRVFFSAESLQFLLFLQTDMTQNVETLPNVRQRSAWSTLSISWLLMAQDPGH